MSVTADKVRILGWHNSRDNVPTPKPSQQPAEHSMDGRMITTGENILSTKKKIYRL